jgi:ABC-type branched-subunit amino acid transport system permease subunit
MLQQYLARFGNVRDGFNNGLIAGGVILFLILIGLPAALPGREPLAPLAIPIFLLTILGLGVAYVRRDGQHNTWPDLAANGLALGLASALVFVLFMGFINRWQARPDVNVQDYFAEVTVETTSRLSGVDVEELGPNPEVDPLTQTYPEDAVLRTSPMTLTFNNDEITVFNLGILRIGGIYGTALVFTLMGLLGVVGYRALLLIDWDGLRHRRDEALQRPMMAETLHWLRILLPAILFFVFFLSVPDMNYDVGFWRGDDDASLDLRVGEISVDWPQILSDDTISDLNKDSAILDLQSMFGVGSRAAQNLQLIVAFGLIISFLVALRNIRYRATSLHYSIRLLLILGTLLVVMLLAIWRIDGNQFGFIIPSLDFLPNRIEISLIVIVLISGLLGLYATFNAYDPYRFEGVLVATTGIAMLLALPLFMDQYQTSVLNIVAINVMLGLGLNIVVGYAGLLDLGYVAFFAIGAYVYAFVESTRQQISADLANEFFFNVATAVIIVPIVVFGAAYLWNESRRSAETASITDRPGHKPLTKRLRPLWKDSPPWYVSFLLVILAITVALGSTQLMESAGVFDGVTRASPFIVGLILAVLASAAAGVVLGFPVLRLRSDYLAIVTLGFGEIISVVLENWEDVTGGAFGADAVPKPLPQGSSIAEGNLVILYLAIIGSAMIALLSLRLRASRLGRSWTALRSDEDIAQAMGINLVNSKLLAFAIGAAFAGAAGMIFASRQVNIRPPNFSLVVSINVLSLVIIGGMGSIPGVIVGAIALVGLPEMLRALSEYRILAFGGLLVFMMLVRPEGLMPTPLVSLEERARQLRERMSSQSKDADAEGDDDE